MGIFPVVFMALRHQNSSTKVLGEAGLSHRLQRLRPVDVGAAEVEIEDGDLVKRVNAGRRWKENSEGYCRN